MYDPKKDIYVEDFLGDIQEVIPFISPIPGISTSSENSNIIIDMQNNMNKKFEHKIKKDIL